MGWQGYTVLSIIFFTALALLQRKIAVNTTYPRAASFVFDCWALFFVLLLAVVNDGYKQYNFNTDWTGWMWVGIACITYAVYERLRFRISKIVEASILTIIGNVAAVVAFVIAVVLYNETPTLDKLVGALLVIGAIVLLAWKAHKKVLLTGIILAIVSEAVLGVGWGLDKMGVMKFNVDTYNLLLWGLPLVFVYLPHIPNKELIKEAKTGGWKIVLLAFINVTGYWFQLKALEIAEASRVIILLQTTSLFVVMGGVVLLKERDNLLKKFVALGLGIGGAMMLIG